jgi:hypothetical protein
VVAFTVRLDDVATIMELQAAGSKGASPSSSRSRMAYSRVAGPEKLLRVTFTQPLRLKRGILRSAVAADAVVVLQLAVYGSAGRTFLKLQRVQAWLRAGASGGGPSVSGGHAAQAALAARGVVLQGVALEFRARSRSAAAGSSSGLRGLTIIEPPKDRPRIVTSRTQDYMFCRCSFCCDTPAARASEHDIH